RLGMVTSDTVRDIPLRQVPNLVFDHATVREFEGVAHVFFSAGGALPAGGARFTLVTRDGTATSDNDYDARSVEVSWPEEGSRPLSVLSVPIKNDPWKEPE